jgi:hypothetical protein
MVESLQVASMIGFRSPKRPTGYYQDITNLDWELSCFIAAGWVHMPPMLEPLLVSSHKPDAAEQGDSSTAPALAELNSTARGLAVELVRLDEGCDGSVSSPRCSSNGSQPSQHKQADEAHEDANAEDDAEGGYFYNTITQQISLDEPQIPELVETDEGTVLIEDEQQRLMPRMRSLHEGAPLSHVHASTPHSALMHGCMAWSRSVHVCTA